MEKNTYGIALDIGTTNLVMSLVDLKTGDEIQTIKAVNEQRAYGIDVISRIQAANEGKLAEMQVCIQNQLMDLLLELMKKAEDALQTTGLLEVIKKIVVVGNVTMCHILRGYSCQGLGRAPFTPVTTAMEILEVGDLFGAADDLQKIRAKVTIFPGISTFVGGDIVAGIYACDMDKKDAIQMLVDIGTNGEIVLFDKEKFWVTSTAAGCAFENHMGISGSALIDLLAKLLREEIIDENGTLAEAYFERGYLAEELGGIRIKQSYIRALQLGKAAIRTGMELLSKKSKPEIYEIAGVFGMALNVQNAMEIGLFPDDCLEKMQMVGNTALAGAKKYLLEPNAKARIEDIVHKSTEILLVNEAEFEEKYVNYMQVKY